jgi:plasmid rolling circle replication initiator protein Rep
LITEILQEPSFKNTKIKTLPIIDRYMKFNSKKANQVLNCGQILWLTLKEHRLTLEQKLKLAEMYTCKDRFCPFCNWRRELKYKKLIYNFLDELHIKKNLRYIFLTLTVPNCHINDLRVTIQHMNKSFQRMKETKRFKNSILGFLRVLEYTIEKKRKDYIHPHFHCMLAVEPKYFTDNRYIKQIEFLEMWRKATRNNSITSVDIRIVKPKSKCVNKKGELLPYSAVIAEMCKYPLKNTDISKLSDKNFEKLVLQLKNIRNINAGGILKGILKKTKKIDDDLVHIDEADDAVLWREIKKVSYCFENRANNLNYYLCSQYEIKENEEI